MRNKLRGDIAAPLARERAAVEAQVFRGVAAAHAQTREQYLRHLIQNIGTDPNDPLLTGGINAYHATIDNARDRRLITPEEALAEKRRAALALCEGEYAGMARRDPARAIRELHGEAKGHPLLTHLPQERKDALLQEARERQAANATDVELAARRALSRADFNFVAKQFVDAGRPEDVTLARDRSRLIDFIKFLEMHSAVSSQRTRPTGNPIRSELNFLPPRRQGAP